MSAVAAASKGSSLIVAASMATVEALKDQGFARWNYTIRSLHHYAKTNLLASTSSVRRFSSTARPASASVISGNKFRKTEKAVNKVMDLNCWGPTTVRF